MAEKSYNEYYLCNETDNMPYAIEIIYKKTNDRLNSFRKLNAPEILLKNISFNYEEYLEKTKSENIKNVAEFINFLNQAWNSFQKISLEEIKKAYANDLISKDFLLRLIDWIKNENAEIEKQEIVCVIKK